MLGTKVGVSAPVPDASFNKAWHLCLREGGVASVPANPIEGAWPLQCVSLCWKVYYIPIHN